MSGLHFKKTAVGGRTVLICWRESGRAPSAKECEELGEDFGFFDPQIEPCKASGHPQARQVRENFAGELCDHQWGMNTHFDSRKEYGYMSACKKCGVKVARTHARRGNRSSYVYDTWELREHVWRNWMRRGPKPGALRVLPHHGSSGEEVPS